jgi:Leucine-rich repeat (LRR) protein
LLRALTELNKLAHEENKAADNKESILEDLVHLERIMAEKLAEIRAKIDQL